VSPRLRLFLAAWGLLWTLALPALLGYLLWRGRRDPGYLRHLAERLGLYRHRMEGPVWVHAVSLGEMRSAVPLIRALLDRGETAVTTHLTPAGRREAECVFAADITAGRLTSVWLPVETSWAYAGFFRCFRPRAGLVMEVEHWPRMIAAARDRGVPLFPCNAQYPLRSFRSDRPRGLRRDLISRYAGAFVKSALQAERFRATGLAEVHVTGETRFDQPLPPALLAAGRTLRAWLAPAREVVAIASAVEGEDATYVAAIRALWDKAPTRPLILYIPRRPERFGEVHARLRGEGFRLARRSTLFDAALAPTGIAPDIDILLCDSLGEMYAFLTAADRVVVGGGFTPAGAHNIIEPLAVGRPVITGPVTWPIEYPFEEARAAGVALSVPDAAALADALLNFAPEPAAMERFFADHAGATARTLAAFDRLTRR
jgi:3-deoxy-D-manno-octulosonic-acid transferase